VAFIDCDEFLFSPNCATVGEELEALAIDSCGAVGVNWVCFGASGQELQTRGLVIERFTFRPGDQFGPNVHIKSLVRMDRVQSVGPDPHHFSVSGGTVSETGEQISGPVTSVPRHRFLRINHYVTKSREEYLQRISRGRIDLPTRREPAEFDDYQSVEVEDRTIWRFLSELKQRLAIPKCSWAVCPPGSRINENSGPAQTW
jgi:hypothetical protein